MMRGRLVSAAAACRWRRSRRTRTVAWVLDGDRGITYASDAAGRLDAGRRRLVAGRLPRPAAGLLRRARSPSGLGLKVGDDVTVNVLGRNITATIANLRAGRMALARHQLRHGVLAEHLRRARRTPISPPSTFPNGADAGRRRPRSCAMPPWPIPSVTSVRVKDALEAVNDVVAQLVTAIRGASAIALVASLLVLAGALAAGHRARLYDAVVLKTLGATPRPAARRLRPRIRRPRPRHGGVRAARRARSPASSSSRG